MRTMRALTAFLACLTAAPTLAQEVVCDFSIVCMEQAPCTQGGPRAVTFTVKDKAAGTGTLDTGGTTYPVLFSAEATHLSIVRVPFHAATVHIGVREDGEARMQLTNAEVPLAWTYYGTCEGWP